MSMDVDYIAGEVTIKMLQKLLENHPHGEREEMVDDIIEFHNEMKIKYGSE